MERVLPSLPSRKRLERPVRSYSEALGGLDVDRRVAVLTIWAVRSLPERRDP